MARVILFGGGDGGGIWIGPGGIRPIPPFDPGVLRQLRAVNELVHAAHSAPADQDHTELGSLANRAANIAVSRIEAIVGSLDEEHSLVVLDDDGGFTCGTTGKPPIPIPWPPRKLPRLQDLVSRGAVDPALLDFLGAASGRVDAAGDILRAPGKLAQELGIELGQSEVALLEALAPERLDAIHDPVERECVAFFHRVIEDGRFLETWATKPAETSAALGVELSVPARDRLITAGASAYWDPGRVMNPVAIAVVVGVVIMLVDREAIPNNISIQDRSGLEKF